MDVTVSREQNDPFCAVVLGGLAVLLLWFGVYPAPLLNLVRATIDGLN